MVYAELATHTNFSFLRGASHARDLVLTALLLGQSGIGIADRNTVAGVVRAHATLEELRTEGLPPPERVREGSGPGEVTFVEAPRPDLSQEVVKAAAARFRLAVGSRLVFSDGRRRSSSIPRTGWAGAGSAASSPPAT